MKNSHWLFIGVLAALVALWYFHKNGMLLTPGSQFKGGQNSPPAGTNLGG